MWVWCRKVVAVDEEVVAVEGEVVVVEGRWWL